MLNAELLRKTMSWVEQHPETHDQGKWFDNTPCGTKYCFAGHAAILAGAQSPTHLPVGRHWFVDVDGVAVDRHIHGVTQAVEEYARAALGLTSLQTAYLVDGDRTREELRTLVEAIIADPDIHGDDLCALLYPARMEIHP